MMPAKSKPRRRRLQRLAPNAYLLNDRRFGNILFGCPAEITKTLLKKDLSSHTCVLTMRTMRHGRSLIDVEFLLYAALFVMKGRQKLEFVCTESQRKRILTILRESLFCPSMRELLRSLMPVDCLAAKRRRRRPARPAGMRLGTGQSVALDKLIDRLERSRGLAHAFEEAMRRHLSAADIAKRVRPFFAGLPGLRRGREQSAARAWTTAALLKRETRFFALHPGESDEVLERHIGFSLFGKDGHAALARGGHRLTIAQPEPCLFRVRRPGERPVKIDMRSPEAPAVPLRQQRRPFTPPQLGVTFIGAGTGFALEKLTTCSVAWVGGQGVCVDMVAEATQYMRRHGIPLKDVRHVILTHTHSDHDAGLIQRIMAAEKIHLMTSRVVFDSFIRKAEAVTCLPRDDFRKLVDFVELAPGKETPIPGIPRASILFDYSFHSVPTGRVIITYREPRGKRRRIFFSGDTLYDPELLEKLRLQSVLTPERKASLCDFGWDADLIVHEAGGENIHTDLDKLAALPPDVRGRMWLNHVPKTMDRPHKGLRFAREGQTVTLTGGPAVPEAQRRVDTLRMTDLFPGLSDEKLRRLLKEGRTVKKRAGSVIVKEGAVGRQFFILLEGLVQIGKKGILINEYERGDFFGELAILSRGGRRRATIRAKTDVVLFVMSKTLYKKYNLPRTIEKNLYKLVDFFTEHATSSLLSSLAQGQVAQFSRGEDIILVGAKDKTVYILLSGSVDVLDVHDKRVATIKDVDIFGEIAALEGVRRTSTVRASTDVKVLRLSEAQFRRIVGRFPPFYATIVQKARKRLAAPETLRQVMRNEFGFS